MPKNKEENVVTKEKAIQLPCPMTDEEIMEVVDELVELNDSVTEKEEKIAELKDEASKLAKEIKCTDPKRKELNGLLKAKAREKFVDCVCVYEYDKDVVTITRKDNGEQVEQRAITDLERQQALPLLVECVDCSSEFEQEDMEPIEEGHLCRGCFITRNMEKDSDPAGEEEAQSPDEEEVGD